MFNKDIGIDLGTVNILIYVKGQGIVLSEPSVVVVDEETKRPIAFGKEAFDMLGRTPGKIKVIKPMKDGVIADFETTEMLLDYILRKLKIKGSMFKPRILICCPANITEVEKSAIKDAAERIGAKKVFIEEISSSRNSIFIKMINHFSSIQYFILRVNLDRYHSRLDLLFRKEATESYQIYANQK